MGDFSKTSLEHVLASYRRCCLEPTFFDVFYKTLFERSPVIAKKFEHTNLERQKEILRLGVTHLIFFSRGDEYSLLQMKKVAETHSIKNYDIHSDLYPLWKANFLANVVRFDKEHMTPELEREWSECLQIGLDYLASAEI